MNTQTVTTQDLVAALRAADLTAEVVGTGGGCEAVEVSIGTPDYTTKPYVLVTDGNAMPAFVRYAGYEDTPFGIVAGLYRAADGYSDATVLIDREDVPPTPETVAEIVLAVSHALLRH